MISPLLQPTKAESIERLLNLKEWLHKQHTLREEGLPNQWFQQVWMVTLTADDHINYGEYAELNNYCGSVYCCAGYIAHQLLGYPYEEDAPVIAQRYLGLSHDEGWTLWRGDNTYNKCVHLIDRYVAARRV